MPTDRLADEAAASDGYCTSDADSSEQAGAAEPGATSDIEDLAGRTASAGRAGPAGSGKAGGNQHMEPGSAAPMRDMLTPALRGALSKQGYKLIGGAEKTLSGLLS